MTDKTQMTCIWRQEDDGEEFYQTSCGYGFVFIAGSASENGAKFCCYCGKPLEEKKYVPENEDEV